MSTEPQALEEMSREELEQRVAELESRVDDLERVGIVVNRLVKELTAEDENEIVFDWTEGEFAGVGSAAVADFVGTVSDHETTLKRVDSTVKEARSATGSTDDEHWWNVVGDAHNLKNNPSHGLPDNWVKLYRENIAQATGLSEKRGQQLISEWTDENDEKYKRGTKLQEYKPATAGNGGAPQKKAIMIDLDVWEVEK